MEQEVKRKYYKKMLIPAYLYACNVATHCRRLNGVRQYYWTNPTAELADGNIHE
jgi:hypothetical protein